MTYRDAYRALDLAPGLGKDRVESQFQRLTIDLKIRLSQSKSPNLQTFYTSRLKEIEAAKAILDQHFTPNEAKVSDESDKSGIDTEATDDPVDGQQATDDPVDGQQATDDPVDGQQATDDLVDGQQATDDPVDGQQVADNLASESTPTFENNEVNEPDGLTLKSYMFSNPFSFDGRIRRTEYCLSIIILYACGSYIGFAELDKGTKYLLLIPATWFIWAQGAKRCHDIGNSGWHQLIPFLWFWMLFADSEDGLNEYGPNPKGIGN